MHYIMGIDSWTQLQIDEYGSYQKYHETIDIKSLLDSTKTK